MYFFIRPSCCGHSEFQGTKKGISSSLILTKKVRLNLWGVKDFLALRSYYFSYAYWKLKDDYWQHSLSAAGKERAALPPCPLAGMLMLDTWVRKSPGNFWLLVLRDMRRNKMQQESLIGTCQCSQKLHKEAGRTLCGESILPACRNHLQHNKISQTSPNAFLLLSPPPSSTKHSNCISKTQWALWGDEGCVPKPTSRQIKHMEIYK